MFQSLGAGCGAHFVTITAFMSGALSHARAIARIGWILSSTAVLLSARLVALPLAWAAPAAESRVLAMLVRAWARAVSWGIGLRSAIHGTPPGPPVLLVTNHLSYVDILVLLAVCPGVFVAKSEVAGWPGLGLLARSAGTLFVDRRRKRDLPRVIGEMSRLLREGRWVLFFPEATSSPGERVLPFRASLFEAAIRSRVPVATASLRYQVDGAGDPAQVVCWWGPMTFPDHVYRLLRLQGIRATLRFGREGLFAGDREALARAARRGVEALFQPTQAGSALGTAPVPAAGSA